MQTELSTTFAFVRRSRWENPVVIPRPVHTICMQFYTGLKAKITDMKVPLSPLSTDTIIKTIWLTKEKLLIGTGG